MRAITKLALGALTVIGLSFSACTSDEPTPAPTQQPNQPEQPNQPDAGDPNTTQTPAKDWKGELPHGFITEVTSLILPISENGYLMFQGGDEIVIDRSLEPGDGDRPCGAPTRSANSWYNTTNLQLDGEMADPFENTETYISLCKKFGFRPKSQFSDFEELSGLPMPFMQGYFSSDQLSWVDIITEKEFDKGHPAGSSMGKVNGSKVKMSIQIMPGSVVFSDWSRGLSLSGLQGPGWKFTVSRGSLDPEWSGYPHRLIDLTIEGYPDAPGEYPMTLRMAFSNGETTKIVETQFIVKFVGKRPTAL